MQQLNEKGRPTLPASLQYGLFLSGFIQGYQRVYLYQLVLNASQNHLLSVLGWTLSLFLYLGVDRLATSLTSRWGVALQAGLIAMGAWGLSLPSMPQWLIFLLYIELDLSATSIDCILSSQQKRYVYDQLHALEVHYFGKSVAFIASFLLIADELDLEDAFHPSMFHITIILSIGLAILPFTLHPESIQYQKLQASPARGISYWKGLALYMFYCAVVFYSPTWVNVFYTSSQVGASVNASTVLAICCTCLLVNLIILIATRLQERLLKGLFLAVLAVSSVALGLVGAFRYFIDLEDAAVFTVILVANLAAELVPILRQGELEWDGYEAQLGVLAMLVLFGGVPLLTENDNQGSCLVAMGGGVAYLGLDWLDR